MSTKTPPKGRPFTSSIVAETRTVSLESSDLDDMYMGSSLDPNSTPAPSSVDGQSMSPVHVAPRRAPEGPLAGSQLTSGHLIHQAVPLLLMGISGAPEVVDLASELDRLVDVCDVLAAPLTDYDLLHSCASRSRPN